MRISPIRAASQVFANAVVPGLVEDIPAAGAHPLQSDLDPMAHPVVADRRAVDLAPTRWLAPTDRGN